MTGHLPTPADGDEVLNPTSTALDTPAAPPARASTAERLLAYGALTVMVVENLEVAGYPPERFNVTIGGQPIAVLSCGFDVATGQRTIDTALGVVVVPSAAQRARGAQLTVNGMVIPGA